MTTRDRRLLVGLAVLIAVLWLLGQVAPVRGDHPAPWSPPPSAIVAITTAPAPPQPDLEPIAVARHAASGGATATLGLPRGTGAEADHEAPAGSRLPTRSAAALTFVGVASTYGPGWDPRLVALPQGPGWRFRVCGQGGCLVLVSTDKGPDQRLFPGRVVDLPVWAFERVSGQPWTRGITTVSVVILGRKP